MKIKIDSKPVRFPDVVPVLNSESHLTYLLPLAELHFSVLTSFIKVHTQ